ncbi:MAG TPA: prepilin peptidase, partial [Polyangiales bacterium]|nr:prepilin peptidase [Polyangiales bacterium]
MHPILHLLTLAIVLGMLGAAAVTDLRSGLIPNSLVVAGAAAGVLVQLLAAGLGYLPLGSTLGSMSLGLVVCSIAPGVLYALGALGGGDLKLFAAIGLC